jgi:hypothetical protein
MELVLAGPIVRRVEAPGDTTPGSVSVWLATSEPRRVELYLYAAEPFQATGGMPQHPPPDSEGVLAAASVSTITLLPKLHVALVTATPKHGRLPAGQIIAYDVLLRPVQGDASWVSTDPTILCHGTETRVGYQLPTIRLPSADPSAEARILHGSCHKLHGPGLDSRSLFYEVINATISEPKLRPEAILLTGDQIYADDVADEIITHLCTLANDLRGEREERFPWVPKPLTQLTAPGARALISRLYLTPDDPDTDKSAGRNQLLGFSEFAAMHLLSWNENLWPSEQLGEPLENTRLSLPRLRCALANAACYMLLDDHEVTDDWNLDAAWVARASNPVPQRIIANALAAYWTFQAWGNDPVRLSASRYAKPIADYLTDAAYLSPRPTSGSAVKRYLETMSNARFGFVAPTTVPAVHVDSRTSRAYPKGKHGPPALLNKGALDRFANDVSSLRPAGRTIIVVTATPFIGLPAPEAAIDIASDRIRRLGVPLGERVAGQPPWYWLDRETWAGDPECQGRVLGIIHDAKPRLCVLISGDVHYAFGIDATFTRDGHSTMLFQFTSSSLKNAPPQTQLISLLVTTTLRGLGSIVGKGSRIAFRDAKTDWIAAGWLTKKVVGMFDPRTGREPGPRQNALSWACTNLGLLETSPDSVIARWLTVDGKLKERAYPIIGTQEPRMIFASAGRGESSPALSGEAASAGSPQLERASPVGASPAG